MRVNVFVIVILFLFLVPSAFASVTLRQGEVYSISGKSLIVENIQSDKVKINVEGIKNIISIGEQKEVNRVKILVESVFYVDQPEERTVSIVASITFYCGDGSCDTGQNETKENCCEDCGCNPGFICYNKVCESESQVEKEQKEEAAKKEDKCKSDADCNDNNPNTEDVCKSTPGKPNKCWNIPQICQTDLDCDDQDPCTVDRCVNNDCFNTKVPDYDACSEKQEAQEKPKTVSGEKEGSNLSEGEAFKFVQEEKNIFSRIIGLFLSLFK